jgi:hypothetical protein
MAASVFFAGIAVSLRRDTLRLARFAVAVVTLPR